ncbi:MAG: hypothetical protein D6814_13335 [Calditrichaeota bacterium]|nr:MAG: hypothetical protein D6814_13335 [Calditrichota bacterium]
MGIFVSIDLSFIPFLASNERLFLLSRFIIKKGRKSQRDTMFQAKTKINIWQEIAKIFELISCLNSIFV